MKMSASVFFYLPVELSPLLRAFTQNSLNLHSLFTDKPYPRCYAWDRVTDHHPFGRSGDRPRLQQILCGRRAYSPAFRMGLDYGK